MNLYKIKIKIKTPFATIPKGDTIFGHLCWQIVQNQGEEALHNLLSDYKNEPFMVISDFLINNTISKPPISNSLFGIKFDPKKRKEIKAKNIIKIDELIENKFILNKDFINNKTYLKKEYEYKESIVIRNSIDRLTSTTKKGFDPYASYRYDYDLKINNIAYLYILIDNNKDISIEQIYKYLKQIGDSGFGKDASIGYGKFDVIEYKEFEFKNDNTNALITLSPSVLSKQNFKKAWYETFVRFGKHGNYLAHSLVWKNPIILADSFALVISEYKKYIGQGLGGNGEISKSLKETVHQGYAITIPVTLELENEEFI